MTVKRDTFDTITTYEVETEAVIENCSTNIGALESCCYAFLVKSLKKYMGVHGIFGTQEEKLFSAFWVFLHARMIY